MVLARIVIFVIVILILLAIMFFILRNNYIEEKIKLFKLKMLIITGKDEQARKYALKFIDQFPKNFEAHKILGSLYEKQGNISVALDEYLYRCCLC